jgi:pimeloyl-ACP methyl ester carboxylesterase
MEFMKKGLIIHGWTYSLKKYKRLSQILNSKGLKNEILKVPGLTEKIERPWDLDDYINWIKNGINKENGKVVLIGHSSGGRIAAAFASKYPQKLEHLMLIDSAGILHDEFHVKLRLLFFEALARIGKKISSSAILKNLLYKMAGENDYKNATKDTKKTMTNLIKTDLSASLAKVTTPTLIIWGEHDKVTPLSDGKIMHQLIKNSRLHIIKSAKHSPHFTHAKEVADTISEYLKTQIANLKTTHLAEALASRRSSGLASLAESRRAKRATQN